MSISNPRLVETFHYYALWANGVVMVEEKGNEMHPTDVTITDLYLGSIEEIFPRLVKVKLFSSLAPVSTLCQLHCKENNVWIKLLHTNWICSKKGVYISTSLLPSPLRKTMNRSLVKIMKTTCSKVIRFIDDKINDTEAFGDRFLRLRENFDCIRATAFKSISVKDFFKIKV